MAQAASSLRIPFSKRFLDLSLTIPGLILISPLLLLLGLLVWIYHGRPILFRQVRPGFKSQPFEIFKFRTMSEARDPQGNLDELPELLNVLRGEMSLVGPRPLLMQYLARYNPEQARRQDVLPGITGWAQINGRNALTWEDKFRLDVWYVDHQSRRLDIKILLITLWKVLQREGISQPGHATAEEFMGSQQSQDQ